jgi:hypothetical protein
VKKIRFPYRRYPANVYRPVLSVGLSSHKNTLEFSALIDSGADKSTFPGWVAQDLGYNVTKGEKKIFSGIGGSVLAYKHKIQLVLADLTFPLDAYFSHQWDDMPFGLLGQEGFFSRFSIAFDYKKKVITLGH